MNQKIKKSLFALSKNVRITTKELGKLIRATQQSSSYHVKQLKKKRIIESTTIVDSVKLGYTNVLVGLDYLNFDSQVQKEILDELRSNESIIAIEEAKQGVDIIIEYASANLSAFNKAHTELIHKFRRDLETKFIFPVIVKHKHLKNYLVRKFDDADTVLCGDREVISLSKSELSVLRALVGRPDGKIVEIAKSTGLSAKSVVKLKKALEKKMIIRGYSCILNNQQLGINRYLLFLRFTSAGMEMDKLVKYALYNKNIIELAKIIGEFHAMLVIEETKETELVKDIRSSFSIADYFVVNSEKIYKKTYLPIE